MSALVRCYYCTVAVTVVVCTKWGVTLESVPVTVIVCTPTRLPLELVPSSMVIVLVPLPPVTVYSENPISPVLGVPVVRQVKALLAVVLSLQVRVTLSPKLARLPTVITDVPLFGRVMVNEVGLALSVKSFMLKELLVGVVSPVLVAVRVYELLLPLLMLQPANVSTPELAFFGFAVQASVPPPGFVPIASVIEAELVVTVFPPASCTVTVGCVVQTTPAVPPPGCVVKANCAAAPSVMLKALLTIVPAVVSTVEPVAVRV